MDGMVRIPGATFLMGSDHHYPEEAPAHKVMVDGFWIDAGPVTGSITCRGSPTLYSCGFHLNICSIRSRSAMWKSSPASASLERKTGP